MRKFHMDYVSENICFSFWIGSFKNRHFALYRYIFHVCEFRLIKKINLTSQRYLDGRTQILFAFIILQKHNILVLLWQIKYLNNAV